MSWMLQDILLLTSIATHLTYVHDSLPHLYISQFFMHCLSTFFVACMYMADLHCFLMFVLHFIFCLLIVSILYVVFIYVFSCLVGACSQSQPRKVAHQLFLFFWQPFLWDCISSQLSYMAFFLAKIAYFLSRMKTYSGQFFKRLLALNYGLKFLEIWSFSCLFHFSMIIMYV